MRKIWFQRLVLFIFTGLGFSPLAQNDILASNVLQASDELLVPSEVLASNVTVSNPLMFSSIDPIVIKPVTVEGQSRKDTTQASPFTQKLTQQQLQTIAGEQVSDAVRFFSGALVKDYGGLGGVKTLSVRNFGAQHTAVSYDGLVLSDCQSGQIDIGRFMLGNIEQVDYQIGSGGDLFQTARAFASTGMLSLVSKKETFAPNQPFKGRAALTFGSFDTKSAQLAMSSQIGSKTVWNIQSHWLQSEGDFPYKEWISDSHYQMANRSNNANEALTVETNVSGAWTPTLQWDVKAFYNQSDKQLPGAILLYNTHSNQQLWDNNGFVQGRVEGRHPWKGSWKFLGKYQVSKMRYLNPDYLGSTGKEDYNYDQREAYTSLVMESQLTDPLQLSISVDAAHNTMTSNMNRFPFPVRNTLLGHLGLKYAADRLETSAGVLGSNVWEQTQLGAQAHDTHRLSPWFHVLYQPFEAYKNLQFKLFYKSSFRMPSFNDLYYTAVGNTRLKPETAHQWNLGVVLHAKPLWTGLHPYLSLDAYHNRILDKIQAVPTKNLFVWSMTNVGEAQIQGLDATLGLIQTLSKKTDVRITWNHSYQKALDVSNPDASTYKHQLAYAPRVYGSVRTSLRCPVMELGYNVVYSGHRYVSGQNLAENDIPGYQEHQLSLTYPFKQSKWRGSIKCEIQNLWNASYDIVRNFPMPGRSFRTILQIQI